MSSTIGGLLKEFNEVDGSRKGTITQIDADTVRVKRWNSPKTLSGVPVVGASITQVSVGEVVEIRIVSGKPCAYKLKSN